MSENNFYKDLANVIEAENADEMNTPAETDTVSEKESELKKSDKKQKQEREQKKKEKAVYKAKYGRLYSVATELVEDDENREEVEYFFKKPNNASYNRYIKTASKDFTKSLQVFMMENIIEEQEEQLLADMDKYPAMPLGVGQKLLTLLGLSDNVNLTKL